MKKIIFSLLFLLPISVSAESVMIQNFSGITGSYQINETNGVFFNHGSQNLEIYSKTGSLISSFPTGESFDYKDVVSFGNGKRLFVSGSDSHVSYGNAAHAELVDLDTQNSLGFFSVRQPGTVGFHGLSGNRNCNAYTKFRSAVQGGSFIFQVLASPGPKYGTPCPDYIGTIFQTSTNNPDEITLYSGTEPQQWLDMNSIDNDYLQVIGDSAMIYKKSSSDSEIYLFQCNEFLVCSESLLFGIPNLIDGYYIKAFKFHYTTGNNQLGFINLYITNGVDNGLLYLPFSLDEQGAFVYEDYVYDKWIHKVFIEGNGYKLFVFGTNLFQNGVVPDFLYTDPLIVWEDFETLDDNFFYVKDDLGLYNFGGSFEGVVSESTGTDGNSEVVPNTELWNIDACSSENDSEGFMAGVSSFFSCASQTLSGYFQSLTGFISKITDLFQAIGNIGNVDDQKKLHEVVFDYLIPSSHADSYTYNEDQDVLKIIAQGSFENITLLDNIYNLIKYLCIGLILYSMIITLRPKND